MGATVDHSVFDAVLFEHVRDDFVDYTAIRETSQVDLNSYLDLLAIVDPGKLARNEQLTFYINLHNAALISAITQRHHPGYSVADDKFAVFKDPIVRLKSGAISLTGLRDRVIRPSFKDPRIHVALFLGAVSSHPMFRRAYHPIDLERVLEENMKFFVTDRIRNPLDEQNRELRLSSVFDWNADDFGGKNALPAYLSKYCGRDYLRFALSFVDFDWTLNVPIS